MSSRAMYCLLVEDQMSERCLLTIPSHLPLFQCEREDRREDKRAWVEVLSKTCLNELAWFLLLCTEICREELNSF